MVTQHYENMKRVLAECEADVLKAAGGNKAAGTRVRKAMQDVKNIAQELRKSILDAQKTD
ncbi:MAG: histone H1 [Planctomycetaceae bacterium]|jgi:hypothetical protein|nr:histone H1 [Planctomycetaceae bacterium]